MQSGRNYIQRINTYKFNIKLFFLIPVVLIAISCLFQSFVSGKKLEPFVFSSVKKESINKESIAFTLKESDSKNLDIIFAGLLFEENDEDEVHSCQNGLFLQKSYPFFVKVGYSASLKNSIKPSNNYRDFLENRPPLFILFHNLKSDIS